MREPQPAGPRWERSRPRRMGRDGEMNDEELLSIQVTALGDQVIASLRAEIPTLESIAGKDPSAWTDREQQIAQMAVCAVLGMLSSPRI